MKKREPDELISRTELYVKDLMANKKGVLAIAHDFKHVDRVRNWALVIAKGEAFSELKLVEITALLHDIGLAHFDENIERRKHAEVGAEMAAKFLKENSKYDGEQIKLVADAIKYHSSSPKIIGEYLRAIGESGKLLEILLDADAMDAMGAVGLMRAFTSKYFLPEYDPDSVKGNAWGLSFKEVHARFGNELGSVECIVDQINQQIRYHENLHSITAKQLAGPLIKFMKDFVLQLEREITYSKGISLF